MNSYRKKQLSSLLTTYNLYHSIYFPLRIQNCNGTLIDNSYTDYKKRQDFSDISTVNVLSHDNGQYSILKNFLP